MDDLLELIASIPYSERSSGGAATLALRKSLQERYAKRQQQSLLFQSQSAAKNRATSTPEEIQQMIAQMENPDLPQPGQQAQVPNASQQSGAGVGNSGVPA